MERVRSERGAVVALRRAPQDDRATEVDDDHDPDHQERVPGRLHVRLAAADEMRQIARHAMKKLASTRIAASPSAARCSALPCPYWCDDVGGPDRDPDGEEGQERRDEIGARMQCLRDEAETVGREAGAELEDDEDDRGDHRDERGSPLGVHAASETEEPAVRRALRRYWAWFRLRVAMSPRNSPRAWCPRPCHGPASGARSTSARWQPGSAPCS